MNIETPQIITPFGQRSVSLSFVMRQLQPTPTLENQSVDKWEVFRNICEARSRLKLRDRALAVLNALLSFHPERILCGQDNLVVFPSNQQLSSRANGISGTTLRHNLALLAEAGLIQRRDSPNGKRYCRKKDDGQISEAFGFNLLPLVVRSSEFAGLAKEAQAEQREMRILREKITLLRRNVSKVLSSAFEEQPDVLLHEIEADLRGIPHASRRAGLYDLQVLHVELVRLQDDLLNHLKKRWKNEKTDANDHISGHHIDIQNTESLIEFDSATENPKENARPGESLPLATVLRSCEQIVLYGPKGTISSWKDLMSAAVVVRSMLGVSPSAYRDACDVMGPEKAAIAMACILERAEHIRSHGGYLRDLTRKSALGVFSLLPMVAALRAGSSF